MKQYDFNVHGETIRVWHDKVWYAFRLDAEGNQIGSTVDSSSKELALILIGIQLGGERHDN